MEKLLPDQLKELWECVEAKELTAEDFNTKHEHGLAKYRKLWRDALLLEGQNDLQHSLLYELGRYMRCDNLGEIEERCRRAVDNLAIEWRNKVDATDPRSIESFYDQTEEEIYELMWWHTLAEDLSPLAYVTALQFAQRERCRNCLDFGAGVGSGSLLFVRGGLKAGLADISSPLLEFSRWRFQVRHLPADFFDLKNSEVAEESFDMVTAMDVFEHLADPVDAVERLSRILRPGGFLFGRFGAEPYDEERPLHVVQDFEPSFKRLSELGFVQVWRDEWLWGHQVFKKL